MVKTNIRAVRVKPEVSEPLILRVQRTAQISPHFVRITFGDGDIERFTPMGYDQWFRLFIPAPGKPLPRLPDKLTVASYLRYLTISKQDRPILRSYSVRAYRSEGPEIDVDFVLHDPRAGHSPGPAASWARTCRPADQVAILDEGVTFNLPADTSSVLLVADESGLPAIAGILASLPRDISGRALGEQALPVGLRRHWIAAGLPKDRIVFCGYWRAGRG
ncbi:siderophore-interacting protein [Nonomuraea sp. NPDC026600]|uniref:siderophore-interacting protein n=1 Tax=Nonomuraea sp. NPDC026600 TaxID=3155363 RepID=UPI0034006F1E